MSNIGSIANSVEIVDLTSTVPLVSAWAVIPRFGLKKGMLSRLALNKLALGMLHVSAQPKTSIYCLLYGVPLT